VSDLLAVLAEELDLDAAIPIVCQCVMKLTKDTETFIRSIMAQKLLDLIELLVKHGTAAATDGIHIILEVLPQLLCDRAQIRTAGKAVLVAIFRLEALPMERLQMKVSPLLKTLAEFKADGERTPAGISDPTDLLVESISLMTGLAEYVGSEFCRSEFLPKLKEYCTHESHLVRKACPEAIAALSQALNGKESMGDDSLHETFLCPLFEGLLTDEIWGVRKSCAEFLSGAASGLSLNLKNAYVAAWFSKLAQDSSRWVRSAAFKKLGALIATFAPPIPLNGLPPVTDTESEEAAAALLSMKVISEVTVDDSASDLDVPSTPHAQQFIISPRSLKRQDTPRGLGHMSPDKGTDEAALEDSSVAVVNLASAFDELEGESSVETAAGPRIMPTAVEQAKDKEEAGAEPPATPEQTFNSDAYWRSPVTSFDLDALLADVTPPPPVPLAAAADADAPANPPPLDFDGSGADDTKQAMQEGDAGGAAVAVAEPPVLPPVPEQLLEYFNQMALAESARTVDIEVARDCAFSFPAILWATGRSGWHHVRETYLLLSSNDDWRVRSTLAHSIHVCAQILGRKITDADLVPRFEALIDDWDSVKIGVVKHFSEFMEVMSPELRKPYLTRLMDLCETDDATNWRPRRLLAGQICKVAPLCSLSHLSETMCPLALSLALHDTVASVRDTFYRTVAVLASRLQADNDLAATFCQKIVGDFHQAAKGVHRVGFVKVCFHFASCVPETVFETYFLTPLLEMQNDPVAVVRVALARLLSQVLAGYVSGVALPKVEAVLDVLKVDRDVDCKFFAGLPCVGSVGSGNNGGSGLIPAWNVGHPDQGLGDERMALLE
jgi:serine/threonine-protein phosphatase 4 regulatory subunit 1